MRQADDDDAEEFVLRQQDIRDERDVAAKDDEFDEYGIVITDECLIEETNDPDTDEARWRCLEWSEIEAHCFYRPLPHHRHPATLFLRVEDELVRLHFDPADDFPEWMAPHLASRCESEDLGELNWEERYTRLGLVRLRLRETHSSKFALRWAGTMLFMWFGLQVSYGHPLLSRYMWLGVVIGWWGCLIAGVVLAAIAVKRWSTAPEPGGDGGREYVVPRENSTQE